MPIYFKYGNYQHSDAECSFIETKEIVRSDSQKPTFTRCRWDIMGSLIRATPALITAAIKAMRTAYSVDGQDAGWYLTGGTPTAHTIKKGDTVGNLGVRVVRPPHFPESSKGAAEYTVWRNYSLALEWDLPAEKDLVSWTQTLEYEGDGGPDWGALVPVEGLPIPAEKTEYTPVVVRQSGTAIGCNGYFPPSAAPIWPQVPPRHGPSNRMRFNAVPGPARLREVTWSYTFIFGTHPGWKQNLLAKTGY